MRVQYSESDYQKRWKNILEQQWKSEKFNGIGDEIIASNNENYIKEHSIFYNFN